MLRKCIFCGLEATSLADLELFVKNKASSYGRMNQCKKCWNNRMVLRRYDDKKYLKHIFQGMKQRCYNPKNNNYPKYGAKGTTICQSWLKNPESFVEWALSNGFKKSLLIDRMDNENGYSPNNCRWIDAKLSSYNRRCSTTDINAGTRRCARCGKIKALKDFPRSKNRFQGRGHWCKACFREYKKLRYTQ